MKKLDDKLNGFLMDSNGRWDNSVPITNNNELESFISNNVETTYELRITDKDDCLVFHCVDRVLRFPVHDFGSIINKWNTTTKRFTTIASNKELSL